MIEEVIKVNNLTVKYKDFKAVDNVSFNICANEIFGIIGPNGAGKTSLVEAIEGLRKASEGKIEVLGLDPVENRSEIYKRVGVQLQQTSYPDRAKVEDVCKLFSSFCKDCVPYKELLRKMGLEKVKRSYVNKLSGGERQKLSILLAVLHSPSVVFLDELTTGLDPFARQEVWDMIKDCKEKGMTIILVTHFMDEIENLCDRVAVMKKGKILTIDSPKNIVKMYEAKNLDEAFIKMSVEEGVHNEN